MIFDEMDLDNLPLPPSFNFDEYSYKVVVCTCMLYYCTTRTSLYIYTELVLGY